MKKQPQDLKVVFLGTPDFAVASLKALVDQGYQVVGVVTAPDKPAGRGQQLRHSPVKVYALEQGLPVLQPERLKRKAFLDAFRAWNADVQVVVAFRMLPREVWDMPPMGTINVHASLLPQYRGAAPINWAVINGETETGVTTFRLKHEIDTGNVLLQHAVPIADKDNFGTLYGKLMVAGADLLLHTLKGLLEGTITEQAQREPEGPLHHAPKIYKQDGQINWQQSANEIRNLIRGLAPVPAAFTFLDQKQLKIFDVDIIPEVPGKEAGAYQSDGKTYLRFAAADAWVCCREIQFEGKKRMDIAAFLRGYQLQRSLN